MRVEYNDALAAEMDKQRELDCENGLSEKSQSPPPAYDTATAKGACTNSGQSSTTTEDDLLRDGPHGERWGARKRGLHACMHLMFAVILLFLSAGFIVRATHGKYEAVEEYPTPGDRRTIVHTTSNSITGNYPLLDLLDLETTSGSIYVTVSAEEPDEDGPAQAAEFVAKSTSGDIRANLASLTGIPSRKYITHVSSQSGTVSGTYFLSSMTSFTTTSGSINIMLLPATYGSDSPSVATSSTSESQDIVVLGGQDPTVLRTLSLSSQSISGTITVRCPRDFEGTIFARTTSGHISVSGQGVNIVRDVHSPGSKYVEATKGSGAGRIDVGTTSGDVHVFIG
ncbi:Domain of unknown function DUF4098 [Lasallia pustulata]|uniref:DUF4097 domain-containing protein n=1 Tax=Lasallia pustulata TaxID=136370 RepID=A0A1W5CUU4_9LECA|nr:Domain of unknown function DUF4098 [Lasallia pustulata]